MGRENMRCHFVPQSYLKRLKNTGGGNDLYTLKVGLEDEVSVQTQSPKNVAQIYNWYISVEMQEKYGIESDQLEFDYQKLFEDGLNKALTNLENGLMTPEDKETIARFISYTLHRVPISKQYYLGAPKKKEDLQNNISEEEAMKRMAEILLMHFETNISGDSLFPFLMESQWMLVRNKDSKSFITSDNPIVIKGHSNTVENHTDFLEKAGVSEVEMVARKTGYCITVSPSHVLYINTGAPLPVDRTEVDTGSWNDLRAMEYNDIVTKQALSTIISGDKTLLEEYKIRVNRNEITNSEFVDDPWNDQREMLDNFLHKEI